MSNFIKNSAVIYTGPSLLDGSPIVVIAQQGSNNSKTGDMLQTFILHAIIDPVTANRTGADEAICGSCIHRGTAHDGDKGYAEQRTCYVNIGQAPLGKFKAYVKGRYETIQGHTAIAAFGRGAKIRIGTYGDGAAVPTWVWDSLCSEAEGWTAYSHQNSNANAAHDASRYMTSVESIPQAQEAWNAGERTFRVISNVLDMIKGKEILCPASAEAGRKATCFDCGLGKGSSIKAKSIAIVGHGPTASRTKLLVAA